MDTEVGGTGIPLWLVIMVVLVSLVLGASMISVVLGKYAIKQWFHPLGGSMLLFFGVVLVAFSVDRNVKLKAGEYEAEISKLTTQLEFAENKLVAQRETLKVLTQNSGDTPAQKAAREAYAAMVERCMEAPKGQRAFCLLQANSKYQKGMGW